MIPLASLWLPIVLAAVLVFVASSLVHMVLRWHAADYRPLTNEDEVRAALRKGTRGPGLYVVPHCADMKQMQSPEMQAKFSEGPIGYLFIAPTGLPKMGTHLGRWIALTLVVAALAGYVASIGLPAGAAGMVVFRSVFVTALLAYGVGPVTDGIWYARPWGGVAKDLLDALIYGVATALPFAWLWPHG